jgi:DNA-binding NarL/FixJ family response regulator
LTPTEAALRQRPRRPINNRNFRYDRISRPKQSHRDPNNYREEIVTDTLTPRERDIVEVLTTGCSNREIAQRLGLREQTVKNQLTCIYEKFGVTSRLKLNVAVAQLRADPREDQSTLRH